MRYLRIGLLSLFALAFAPMILAQELQALQLERIQRATVFIIQAQGDDLSTTCIGSGTLVRPDGLILTNAHNTVTSSACPGDTLIIAMTIDLGSAPIPKYRAEIVQSDLGLDIALLRITRQFDGRLIDQGELPILPFVDVGDAQATSLDTTLTFVGYPSLRDEPVAVIRGTIEGFIAEPSSGDRAWVKVVSVSPLAGFMSGGGAYDNEGRLVGIPTSAPPLITSPSNCLTLEDNNGDGTITDADRCVPVGDNISALRPVDFARPLIRSASLGLQVSGIPRAADLIATSAQPTITRLFSAPAVNGQLPTTVAGSLPSGTTSLYLFFDYQNMTPLTVYEVRVTVDGVPYPRFSLPPVRWSGGQQGLWYIGSSGQPFPNGVYEFRIFVDGLAAASHTVVVGGPTLPIPSFSNLVFGLLDEAGNLQGTGDVLPTGTTATARFIFSNMAASLPWTALWYYGTAIVARSDAAWNEADGVNGSYSVSLQPVDGLIPGDYRLELYINNLLAATGDFVIAGAQQGALPQVFSNLQFYGALSADAAPSANPASSYPDGAAAVYARFDWQQVASGMRWRIQWLVDEIPFYDQTEPWLNSSSGSQFNISLTAPQGVPDGTYTLNIFLNSILLLTGEFSIGIGQLEIDRFSQASGVQLRGRIIDADTGLGIENAAFFLISEQFSVADFTFSESQLFATAITDREGRFEIDRPLSLDTPYSVYVQVEGFLPISADGFSLDAETPNPLEITIPMTKD